MKLRCLYLDDAVVIPRSKDQGSGIPLTDTRDSSFHVDDGWDIRETLPGVFSITNAAMGERIVTIGGYGYSYERAEAEVVEELPPGLVSNIESGKRRRK